MLAALAMAGVGIGKGAAYIWDPTLIGVGGGGPGTWDNVTANWFDGAADVLWPNTAVNADEAVFGGVAGTGLVTLGAPIFANRLTFNTNGYNVGDGGVFTNTLTLSGATPTVTVTNGADTATINAIIAGSAGFTKSGAGTLTLGGANTFGGNINVNGGALVFGAEAQLGNANSAINLSNGAAAGNTGPQIILTAGHSFNIGAGGGAITGNIRLQNNGQLTGAATLTVGGTLLDIVGSNTGFTGNTVVSAGVFELRNNTALGNTAGQTVTVNSGATFSVATGVTNSQPVTANAGSILGFHNGAGGVYASPIMAAGNATIQLKNWYDTVSQSGAITGPISGSGNLALTTGTTAATLTLSGDNSGYTGAFSVPTNVTLAMNSTLSRGAGAISLTGGTARFAYQNGAVSGANVNGLNAFYANLGFAVANVVNEYRYGYYQLTSGQPGSANPWIVSQIDPSINVGNQAGGFEPVPGGAGVQGFSWGTNTGAAYKGVVNIANTGSYTFIPTSDDGTVVWIDGAIVSNNDGGHGFITGANTPVTLSAGPHNIIIKYGQGTGGAGFVMNYSGPDTGNASVLLGSTPGQVTTGTVVTNIGDIAAVSGTSSVDVIDDAVATSVSLAGGSTLNVGLNNQGVTPLLGVTVSGTSALSGTGTATLTANVLNVNYTGAITGGAQGLTLNGPGRVTFGNANTYTGLTTVSKGQLVLNNVSGGGNAISGNLTVNVPTANADPNAGNSDLVFNVDIRRGEQIADTATVTLQNGFINLNGNTETIGTLAMSGGAIFGSGTLNVTNLGGSTLTAGTILPSLGGAGGLTINTAGKTVVLAGANNSYTGITAINAGTVQFRGSLGAAGAGNITTVASGAQLQLLGNITGGEDLTIAGNGIATGLVSPGAIRSLGGTQTLGGIALTGDATIRSAGFIRAASIGGGNTLTIDGVGDVSIGSAPGVSAIIKNGTGAFIYDYDVNNVLPTITWNSGAIGFNGTQTGLVQSIPAGKAFKFNSDPGAGTSITAPAGTAVIAGYPSGQNLVDRIASGSGGALVLTGNSATALNFANGGQNVSLGANGLVTYSGTITPNAGAYNFGGTFGGGALQNILSLTQGLSGANAVNVKAGGIVDLTRVAASTNSGALTIDGGTLQFTNSNSLGDGSATNGITLTNGGTLRLAQTSGSAGANFSLLGYVLPADTTRTVTIGAGGGAIDVPAITNGANGLAFSSKANSLTGAAGTTLTKSGFGVLYLGSSSDFAGNLSIGAQGGFVELRSNGALANVAAIAIEQNGQLTLQNNASLGITRIGGFPQVNSANRINDAAPITLRGGGINLVAFTGQTSTETFGTLNLGLGQSFVNADVNVTNPTNAQAVMTFADLTRTVGSTLRIGGNLGTLGAAPANNTTRVFFNNIAGTPPAGLTLLGGWGTVFGNDFLAYNTTTGVTAATYGAANTFGTGVNAQSNATFTLPAGDTSAAALKLNAAAAQVLNFTGGTDRLFIESGGIVSDNQNFTRTIGTATVRGVVTAGPVAGNAVPRELFIHQNSASIMEIFSNIADNNGQAVTLVKDLTGTFQINSGTANSYSGGTFITQGRVNALAAGGLGTGGVVVKAGVIEVRAPGAVATGAANPAAGSAVYTLSDVSELYLNAAAAFTNATDRFELGAGSNVTGQTTVANQGLNSLTRIPLASPFTAGGQIKLAPGAVVRVQAGTNVDLGTTNNINNLGTDADLYLNVNATTGSLTSVTVGTGTPWRGFSAGAPGMTFTTGTIFANSDFELQGTYRAGAAVAVNLGVTNAAGSYSIVNNAGRPINALVTGTVIMNEDTAVSISPNITFVVSSGSQIQPTKSASFGSGSNVGKLLVQAGGTADPGGFVNVGLAANMPVGFAYPLLSPINGQTTIEAGGRLLLNDASGFGSAAPGTVTMKTGSVLHLGNAQALLGSGGLLFGGTNTGIINQGQIVYEPGVIVRYDIDNVFRFNQAVLSEPNGSAAMIQIFNGNRTLTSPTNPMTTLVEPDNIVLGAGGILTNDNVDSRAVNSGGYGGRIILNNGATIASSSGAYFNVGDDIDVPVGANVNIGSAQTIDGIAKLGAVQLNASNSNRIAGNLVIQPGAQLSFQGVNVYPDTKSLDLPAAATNLAGNGIIPGTGSTLLINNGTAEIMGALTGNGAVIGNNAAALHIGYGGADFTFNGVFSNSGSQQVTIGKLGAGRADFTGTSTSTGTMNVYNGTAAFSGAGNAAFATYAAQKGGTLLLDNSGAAANAVSNRLGGTTKNLTLPGGEFKLVGNATAAVTESLGQLQLSTIGGNAFVTVDASAGGQTELNFTQFNNSQQGGNGATFVFRSPSLAAALPVQNYTTGATTPAAGVNGIIRATTAANLWSNNASNVSPNALGGGNFVGSIGTALVPMRPDILGDTSLTGTGTGFVTQDSLTSGVRLLNDSEYARATFVTANDARSLNLKLSNPLVLNGGATSVASLTLLNGSSITANGFTPFSVNPARFIVQTGGILVPAGNSSAITAPYLGNTTNNTPFYFYAQGDLTVNAGLNSNNGFNKNGPGTLTLGPGAVSLMQGNITINEGTVVLGGGAGQNSFYVAQPTAANAFNFTGLRLNLNGGMLDLAGKSQIFSTLISNGNLANSNSSSAINAGVLTSAAAASVTVQTNSGNEVFAGNIGGAISLTKAGANSGANALTLTRANDYTGDTFIRSGTLRLRDDGRLTASQNINIFTQGTLEIDNTGIGSTGGVRTDRLSPTATVNTFGNANINLIGGRDAAAQTINTLNLQKGGSIISVGSGQSTSAELTINNFNRTAGAIAFIQASTLNVTGGGTLGNPGTTSTNPRVFINNLNGSAFSQASLVNGLIGGWATDGNNFLTYKDGQGVSTVSNLNGGFVNYTTTDITNAVSTDNVNDNGAARTVAAAKTINSLKLSPAAAQTITLNGLLTVGTGGILANVNQAMTINGTGGLTSGGPELFVTNAQNTITIATPIVDNGGTVSLVKTGGASLTLTGDNTFTGKTFVDNGTLTLNRTTAGTALAGDVEINGGTLTLAKSDQIAAGSTLTINGGGTFGFSATGFSQTLKKVFLNGTGASTTQLAFGGATAGTVTLTDPQPITVVNDNITREVAGNGVLTVNFAPSTGTTSTFDVSGSSPFGIVFNSTIASVPSGGLIKTGPGIVSMSGSTNFGANPATPTEVLHILGGVVRADTAGVLGLSNHVTDIQTGGTLLGLATITGSLKLNGGTLGVTIANPTFAGNVDVAANSRVNVSEFYIGNTARQITISGLVSGAGNLNVSGPALTSTTGTLLLSNPANTYTGAIAVNNNVNLISQPATSGSALGSATVNLAGGTLTLRSDTAQTFANVVNLTAGSTINVDRSTANTGLTHTINNLNVTGDSALNLTNGNTFTLRVGTLDGTGTLIKRGTVGLTIDAFSGTASFGVAGAAGRTTGHTFNTVGAPNQVAAFTPTTVDFPAFKVGGFYITPASKILNVGAFSVDPNEGNLPGALAVSSSTTISAGTFVNNGQVGATGGAATISAAGGFSGSGIYVTSGQQLTLAGSVTGGVLRVAGPVGGGANTVRVTGSNLAAAATLDVQSGTLRLAPTAPATSAATIRVNGTAATAPSATTNPVAAINAVLELDGTNASLTHNGNISNSGTVRVSGGTATVTGTIAGTSLTYAPGLLEGYVAATSAIDVSAARPVNPGNFGIRLQPRMFQTNAVTQSAITGHLDNELWTYTGYVKDDDGVFSFAENIDDRVAIWVDGNLVLSDLAHGGGNRAVSTAYAVGASTTTTTAGANAGTPTQNFGPGVTLPGRGDGWHLIELRMANGTGGAGPIAGSGFGVNYGLGYKNGIGALDGADYIKPIDDGTGSLFVTPVGGKGVIDLASGTTLNAGGFSMISDVRLNGLFTALNVTNAGASDTDNLSILGGNAPTPVALDIATGATIAAATLTSNPGTYVQLNPSSGGTLAVGDSVLNGTVDQQGGRVTFSGAGGGFGGNLKVGGGATAVVLASGSISGTVDVAGTLRGSGTVFGAVNVNASGKLAPGDSTTSPGTLEITDTLTFGANSNLTLTVGGNTPGDGAGFYSQVNETSTFAGISLDSTATLSLSIVSGTSVPIGSIYYFVNRSDSGAYSTFFSNAAQGATVSLGSGFSGTITYTANWTGTQAGSGFTGGNDIAVMVTVPEPCTGMSLLLGLSGLIGLRRFRRRA